VIQAGVNGLDLGHGPAALGVNARLGDSLKMLMWQLS
jgi:hypothetical protein